MLKTREKDIGDLIDAMLHCKTNESFTKAYDKINSMLDNVSLTQWGHNTINKLNSYKADLYQFYAERILNYQMFPVNFTPEQLRKIRETHVPLSI